MPDSSRSRRVIIGCLIFGIVSPLLVSLYSVWSSGLLEFAGLYFSSMGKRFRVDGFTMVPTLSDGTFILVNQRAYANQTPRRGDIIVYRPASAPGRVFIHRVIGLPGEEIRMEQGRVVVNGVSLNELYILSPAEYEGKWAVKSGEYFVLGDNRNNSFDSHRSSPVRASDIMGKAEWVYWPPALWGRLQAPGYTP